jgi:feruloyl esterase
VAAALLLSTLPAHDRGSPANLAACEELRTFSIANTTITLAEAVTSGSLTAPGGTNTLTDLPQFCRVAGEIKPTPDSRIRFEVWLPLQNWNGKFAGVGNGGFAGTISYGALAEQIRRGYAAGSTDTGHPAEAGVNAARFAFYHPEQLIDFAHRAIHELTVVSKAIVRAHYGRDARYSYFIGCSTGGRQALMEAQRYPLDYDGIIAGAPANNLTRKEAWALDALLAMRAETGSYLDAPAVAVLNRAVLEACDNLDGVRDGLLEDPRRCAFDPATIQCRSGQTEHCLTSAQVTAARRVYAGLKNPRTNELLYSGIAYGSESTWAGTLNPAQPFTIPISQFRWLVLRDSTWDWTTFDFARSSDLDKFLAFDRDFGPVINAFDSDLSAFRRRGGKLLQYHGWNDSAIMPGNSIDYFERVVARAAGRNRAAAVADVQQFYRLYMVPGMNHCRGGIGPNEFDLQTALEAWVEQNRAPEAVLAVHRTNGQQDRSRPLCPYPKVAIYKGKDSIDEAVNFECRERR